VAAGVLRLPAATASARIASGPFDGIGSAARPACVLIGIAAACGRNTDAVYGLLGAPEPPPPARASSPQGPEDPLSIRASGRFRFRFSPLTPQRSQYSDPISKFLDCQVIQTQTRRPPSKWLIRVPAPGVLARWRSGWMLNGGL
jgi:hypothetical protein